MTQVTVEAMEYLRAYELFLLGWFPNGDGWLMETQKFVDAMRTLATEFASIKREAEARMKKGAHG